MPDPKQPPQHSGFVWISEEALKNILNDHGKTPAIAPEDMRLLIRQECYGVVKQAMRESVRPAKWCTKKEAMVLLGCKDTKLGQLVLEGLIKTNTRGKGKQIKYSVQSINRYLDNPD